MTVTLAMMMTCPQDVSLRPLTLAPFVGRENLILFSRSLLQRDIHLHKQQPTNDQRSQLSAELGSEHEQRQGRQWQQLQQQLNQHGEQRYDQQQLRKEKAKSSQDRPRFQRKTDDFHFWKADWRLSRKRGRESIYIKFWTFLETIYVLDISIFLITH